MQKEYVKCTLALCSTLTNGKEYEIIRKTNNCRYVIMNDLGIYCDYSDLKFTPPYTRLEEMQPENVQEAIQALQNRIDFLEKQTKRDDYLFITEDGVKIYLNDEYYYIRKISDNKVIIDFPHATTMSHTPQDVENYIYFSTELAAKEWINKQNKGKKLIIGSKNIEVCISKNSILVGGRLINIDGLHILIKYYRGSKYTLSDWNVKINNNQRCITIGCSEFSLNEVQSIINCYNEINK